MATPEEIQTAQQKLDRARMERDSWKGRDRHNYEMATHLVTALEKQLSKLLADTDHG
ncbi:hypothetical protein [Stenotrophomonas maltophilia]|uniref:hypothetical protein n=1 Tax=Stenotrophomonas maltophilia TaxID=40324 RepID=UPI00144240AF|nr:hypothetical protein [Stenotrophomonas maltophilia]